VERSEGKSRKGGKGEERRKKKKGKWKGTEKREKDRGGTERREESPPLLDHLFTKYTILHCVLTCNLAIATVL